LPQAVEAERAGFDGIGCSDHLQPWLEGGESGHAWGTTVALMNNSGADPLAAIDVYGREVLPKLSHSPAPS
jgi:alkanesulfonate monooxygenase SsuD/methylene tetrahydromethanopterin reductase-like flavin-dependent oxidoreductase (luciferase family)